MFSSPTHPPHESTDPETVMVELGDASFAQLAVLGPIRLKYLAIVAKSALRQ